MDHAVSVRPAGPGGRRRAKSSAARLEEKRATPVVMTDAQKVERLRQQKVDAAAAAAGATAADNYGGLTLMALMAAPLSAAVGGEEDHLTAGHAVLEIYRVLHSTMERVGAGPGPVQWRADSAYLALDWVSKTVTVLRGAQCRRVDFVVAEKLAREVLEDDLRSRKPIQTFTQDANEEEGQAPASQFLPALGCEDDDPVLTFVATDAVVSTPDAVSSPNGSVTLAELIDCPTDPAATEEPTMLPVTSATPGKRGNTPKLAADVFGDDKILVLDAPAEQFVWFGTSASRSLVNRYLDRMRTQGRVKVKVVRPRMEPVAFRERFRGWDAAAGAGGSHQRRSSTGSAPSGGGGGRGGGRSTMASRNRYATFKPSTTTGILPAGALSSNRPTIAVNQTSEDAFKPICGEVERMHNEFMGSHKVISMRVGEPARDIPLAYTDDESSLLRQWFVHPKARKLVPCPANEVGVFTDADAYVVLHSCKAGARHTAYIWLGAHCPPPVKAAVALQLNELLSTQLHVSGAVDQLTVDQHRESPLLLRLLAVFGRPFTLHVGSRVHKQQRSAADAPGNRNHTVWEVSDNGTYPNKECHAAVELDANAARTALGNGPHANKCYIVASPSVDVTTPSAATVPTRCTVWCGHMAPPSLRTAAERMARRPQTFRKPADLLPVKARTRTASSSSPSSPSPSSTATTAPATSAGRESKTETTAADHHNPDEDTFVLHIQNAADHAEAELEQNATMEVTVVHQGDPTPPSHAGLQEALGGSMCPNMLEEWSLDWSLRGLSRLFSVSSHRRQIGAMFSEELGAGGVYSQDDLEPHLCYVLDAGLDTVYVWFGADSAAGARNLVLRVATEYVLRSQNRERRVVPVLAGQEPAGWRACFRGWCLPAEARPAQSVDGVLSPDEVREEVSAHMAKEGKVLQEAVTNRAIRAQSEPNTPGRNHPEAVLADVGSSVVRFAAQEMERREAEDVDAAAKADDAKREAEWKNAIGHTGVHSPDSSATPTRSAMRTSGSSPQKAAEPRTPMSASRVVQWADSPAGGGGGGGGVGAGAGAGAGQEASGPSTSEPGHAAVYRMTAQWEHQNDHSVTDEEEVHSPGSGGTPHRKARAISNLMAKFEHRPEVQDDTSDAQPSVVDKDDASTTRPRSQTTGSMVDRMRNQFEHDADAT